MNADSTIPASVIAQGNPVWPDDPLRGYSTPLSDDSRSALLELPAHDVAPKCVLSTGIVQGETWGKFENSKISPFGTVVAAAREFEKLEVVAHLSFPALLLIHLDASSLLPDCHEDLSHGFHDTRSGPRQHALAEWLCHRFAHHDLKILLLGPLRHDDGAVMYGLLLLHDQKHRWRRLGFCHWKINHMQILGDTLPGYDFFHGLTEDWVSGDGYFG